MTGYVDTKVVGSVSDPIGQVSLVRTLNHEATPEASSVCTYVFWGILKALRVSLSHVGNRKLQSLYSKHTH